MKRIIITIVLLAAGIAASVAELIYIGKTADNYTDRIEAMDVLVMKDDFVKASELCRQINYDWDNTSKLLDTMLIHDYIDSIGINLSQMKTYIDNCSPEMYFAGSAGAKKGLASIKGSEYPVFDNIF